MKSDDNITAKIYDPLLYFFIKPIRIAVLNELSGYKNKAILDLCCGTGNQMNLLAKHGFTNLHCLDLSPAMLEIARRSDYQINIYNEDATKTNFENELFDIVTIMFAIHEKDKITQENLINESHRLLKNSGLLLVVDFIFDESTPISSKIGISFVERLVGGEHYKNFKSYIQNNCLAGVIKPDKFTPLKSDRKPYKSVSLSFYRKK